MTFIHDDFLAANGQARRALSTSLQRTSRSRLPHSFAAGDIATNRRFENLAEIWLEGDHYKWRAMRANGVDERSVLATPTSVRQVSGLGPHGAAHASQSALSLDPHGAEAVLRHR